MKPQGQLAITPQHRTRLAVVYARTSVIPDHPTECIRLTAQRDQAQQALAWGWPKSAIYVIEDLGKSEKLSKPVCVQA